MSDNKVRELPFNTYSENLRWFMNTTESALGRPISIRQLEKATGFCYEHLRKAYKGEELVGEECNIAICRVLGISAEDMQFLADNERFSRRHGRRPFQLMEGEELVSAWERLEPTQREAVTKFAESLADLAAAS